MAVNGSALAALCLYRTAALTASRIAVEGGVRNSGGTITGKVKIGQPAIKDLLATLPAPSAPAAACPGTACPQGTVFKTGTTYHLLPGTYTAPVTWLSGATACVAPGVYVLRANWTLTAATVRPYGTSGCPKLPAGVTDPGVLLYFAGASHIQINGIKTVWQLHAMKTGAYQGLLYWQAGTGATHVNGTGAFAGGAWYEPRGVLILNAHAKLTATYLAVAGLTVDGGAVVTVTSS
jgi:hypothetical protein